MDNSNIRIWCTYHDEQIKSDYNLYDTKIIKLYNSNNLSLKEDNINYLNKYLSEFVTYYYVWKNQIKSDYVGFCHYRRHFTNIYYEDINDNSVQVYLACMLKVSDMQNHIKSIPCDNYKNIYNYLKQYMLEKYNYSFDEHINDSIEISYAMSYIMTWNTFNKLCEYIFGFLDFLSIKFNTNWKNKFGVFKIMNNKCWCSDEFYATRSSGVLIEVLIGYFFGFLNYNLFDNRIFLCNDYVLSNKINSFIIYHIDDIDLLSILYKKNIKTGVQKIINITDKIDGFWEYKLLFLSLKKYDEEEHFKQECINENINIIELKDNEYIDCEDSFNFSKGNYIIKTL